MISRLLVVTSLCLVSCVSIISPPQIEERALLPTAVQAKQSLTGADIIQAAHQAAGGRNFTQPGSLFLTGYNLIRRGEKEVLWDQYAMWRVFDANKDNAHSANGKVRIEAWSNNDLAMLLTFDGTTTYTEDGPMEDQSANAMWSNNFGFGAVRHALDSNWTQTRKVDRLIDGAPTFTVLLTDPSGGETLFGIRQSDYAIVYVGFDTPRGWHERRYSHFFEKPGIRWRQPGRVRLFYDGQKVNEAVWLDFQIGLEVPDSAFVVTAAPDEPSF